MILLNLSFVTCQFVPGTYKGLGLAETSTLQNFSTKQLLIHDPSDEITISLLEKREFC